MQGSTGLAAIPVDPRQKQLNLKIYAGFVVAIFGLSVGANAGLILGVAPWWSLIAVGTGAMALSVWVLTQIRLTKISISLALMVPLMLEAASALVHAILGWSSIYLVFPGWMLEGVGTLGMGVFGIGLFIGLSAGPRSLPGFLMAGALVLNGAVLVLGGYDVKIALANRADLRQGAQLYSDLLHDSATTWFGADDGTPVIIITDPHCKACRILDSSMLSFNKLGLRVGYALAPINTPASVLDGALCGPDRKGSVQRLFHGVEVAQAQAPESCPSRSTPTLGTLASLGNPQPPVFIFANGLVHSGQLSPASAARMAALQIQKATAQ